MVKDTDLTGKIANIGESRKTVPAPRRMGVEAVKITGPRSNNKKSTSSRL